VLPFFALASIAAAVAERRAIMTRQAAVVSLVAFAVIVAFAARRAGLRTPTVRA
jgi:hypothetical protein